MPIGKKMYEIFRYGSTWLRADFHLHTKSDNQFIYKKDERTFLDDYISKLKEAGIKVGVITNHNKFDQNEFVNLRKKALKEEIFLLPGVELSVNDGANGIHTLVVFSDEWLESGNMYINQFLNVAFQGRTPAEYENKGCRSTLSLLETINTLENYHKDYFIIFAHVEQSSGLWNELDGGRLKELGQNEYFKRRTLAFQKVRTHDLQDRICRVKVQSWFKNWYPAEVEGSDCKSIDEIGSKNGETWLKIGDYTFEAVKYALMDYEQRVRSSKPEGYRHSYIKSIHFEGGTMDGKTIHFSPELNTFIGIRGSGKSSILEVLRYVLDCPLGEKAMDKEYKNKLVAHTLGSGGRAIVTAVDQYGSEFQIKRILNEAPQVYIRDKLQPGISIKETIIRKPIYFGQKDLSASGEGFEKDLVEKLIGERLYEVRRQIAEKKQAVVDIVYKLQKLADIEEKIKEYTQKKQDAEFNLKKFQEYGIEEKLKKQIDFDVDERKLKQILVDIESYRSDLDNFISQHEDEIKNHLAYSSQINKKFFKVFFNDYKKIVFILDRQKSDSAAINEIKAILNKKYEEFCHIKKAFTDEFATIRRKIEAELKEKKIEALDIEEYPLLKRNIDTAEKMLDALNRQKLMASNLKKDLLQALSELNELWLQEFNKIKEILDKINNKKSLLTIEAQFKGDKTGYLSFMKTMFKGSGIRENVLASLVNAYTDFGEIYRDFENAKQKTGSYSATFEKYFFENLKDLLVYQVQNRFTIKYRNKELKHHSLGQRASALILFILNQRENDVIIIDQPEDDLDNQTIYEDVIKLIREIKQNTQFIFATHNANFPVLGDADQIHSCTYEDDTINIVTGSIDCPLLQKKIVDLMEGGKEAFNKRRLIYSIWKSQSL